MYYNQEAALRQKIDKIFQVYDSNKTGTLTLNQLHTLINDMLANAGYSKRINYEEASNILDIIDLNHDGQINKYQLLECFKYLSGQGAQYSVQYNPYGRTVGGMGINQYFGLAGPTGNMGPSMPATSYNQNGVLICQAGHSHPNTYNTYSNNYPNSIPVPPPNIAMNLNAMFGQVPTSTPYQRGW